MDFARSATALLAFALAVPSALATRVASAGQPEARAEGRVSGAAWLGVAMEKGVGTGGVRVRHVVRGSPADRGGIKDGDLIRSVDGAKVDAADEVTRIVSEHAVGDVLVAVVGRGGSELAIRVALAARPTMDEMVRMDHVGAPAPAWIGVEPIGDAPRSLSAVRGKVVLLDFWATWCGPCRVLAPRLSAMQARYGAQGLRVVGVTTEEPEEAATFAQQIGMRYALATDPRGETTREYGVSALPTLFVIDKRGVVRDVAIGYSPEREAQIEALVQRLLAEPATGE
jgi:thiol-disulfide isomerase/thioredoxin